jgi:hypothetical protein
MLAISSAGEESHRFVYFAQQELSLEAYLAIIRARFSVEEVSTFEEWIEDLTEIEDKVAEAADKVWEPKEEDDSLYGRIKAIDQQIAHPEKARAWFAPQMLVSAKIFRFGRFEDPKYLGQDDHRRDFRRGRRIVSPRIFHCSSVVQG